MQPLISIIIPVYNQAEELEHALDSIEKQTYNNIEVIIVDDGSDTPIKNLQFPISNLQFFQQENKGAPAARNRGFKQSKGEYVIFWDADIVAKTDMLQKLKRKLDDHPEASYAYSDFYFGKRHMPAGSFDPERLKQTNYITTTTLIRRKDFPGFDESLKKFQDWDIWLTLLKDGKHGVYVPETLFHIAPGGTMSRWLPRYAYKKPWKWIPGLSNIVKKYEEGKHVIERKHHLSR